MVIEAECEVILTAKGKTIRVVLLMIYITYVIYV